MVTDNVTWAHRFRGGNWGWEQACWHMYLMEQMDGKLPQWCPRLVLDFNADVVAHLAKLSTALKWGTDGRVTEGHTGTRTCILHAPGPSKYVLPSLAWWFDGRFRMNRTAAEVEAEFRRDYAPTDTPKGAHRYFDLHMSKLYK